MKKLKWLLTVCFAVVLVACALAGCADKKEVKVGKYYAEGSTESYIEILEGEQALFVNIDLSAIQEEHDKFGEDINMAEIFSSPVPYEVGSGDHVMFRYHEHYALWSDYDYKNITITFGGNLYTYQK